MNGLMVLLIIFGMFFYLLPAVISEIRKTAHGGAILALNALLGWTVLGWLAALLWAITEKSDTTRG
jgi:hypothetical protein